MSEADRQRRLRVDYRLEELRRKHGLEISEPETTDADPPWGPVGSLAQRLLDPWIYAQLLAEHAAMVQLERARKEP